jgi:hypothetical protein
VTDHRITDLWFASGESLPAIASRIGLSDVTDDCENYWEWVIGRLPGYQIQLDITRTHRVPASETATRIFVWRGSDGRELSDPVIELIAHRLREGGITPVHAGRWEYRSGNDFDLVIVRSYGSELQTTEYGQ